MMYDKSEAIYGALLQEYNVTRLRKLNTARSARIAALKDRADAEKYVAEVRAKIAASFSLPERPADLKAQTVGVIDPPECRIEKIIYESRPDFPVTAHLYLPKDIASPVPAVLFLCGHAQDGKNCTVWTAHAALLPAAWALAWQSPKKSSSFMTEALQSKARMKPSASP